ncbi:MAG: hypothetical protein AB8B52_10415 [Winogradskyella sp.]|uniref:hypothetical protein n=1 Tax=Winogradskyella sp. TaxID=1883156 RepID=UPI00385FFD87
MGYQIEVILTNGRKVSEVYGSKNLLHKTIIDDFDYEEYNFILADYFNISTKGISSIHLMENIINGTTDNFYTHLMLDPNREKFAKSALGAVYGYLERDICKYFGKPINRNKDNWPMLTQYLSDIESRSRSYFKTPKSLDFPHRFFIMVKELETYKGLYTKTIQEKYPENEELMKDLDFIFESAKAENLNIFLCNS